MQCRRCGRENPVNYKNCMYCNTPLYIDKSGVHMHQNRKKNTKTDKAIFISIIALVLVFAILVGVYAFQFFDTSGNGFRSGGGGGGGGGTAVSSVPATPGNTNVLIGLDEKDPDVEIYSFSADSYEVLIGETKTITFTSEIFSNVELTDRDVKVVDENNKEIGYMNDNGVDGDAVQGDGIYTLKKDFAADKQNNVLYYVSAKGVLSNSINMCYYRVFDKNDFDAAELIVAKLNELTHPHLKDDFTIDADKLQIAMKAISNYLKVESAGGNVSYYSVTDNFAHVKLKGGYSFGYSLELSGYSAGGSTVSVASYAPYDSLRGALETLYDDALDGTAKKIGKTFSGYAFSADNNYDLDEVSLNALKKLSNHKVIIWGGHGGYDDSVKGLGSMLMTGELIKDSTTSKYSADITAQRILTNYTAGNRSTYCVTGGFFDKYLGDMDGAFVYLSACSSGKDMLNKKNNRYQLAQSFINKGASAVIANSETIYSEYTYKMQRDILNYMCESVDGVYHTAAEAIEYAKGLNGQHDGSSKMSRPMVFPQNSSKASSFRFKNPEGFVSGNVKDAESGNVVNKALIRVYQNGEVVSKTRTNDSGSYYIKLPVGEYILKITKGHYKSAKIAVEITNNVTIYNETFLLLKVGPNSGNANGMITNAITGENVGGVFIKLRYSWNNKNGNVVSSSQTNETGYYEINAVPGWYTMEYSKSGFITGYKNIFIGFVNFEGQNAYISPEMPDDGEFRIVLSWKDMPKDLDSHLTGPTVDGGRFHLYYKYANTSNSNNNSDYYQLDLDNTDIVSNPSIPETTTIVNQLDGVYRYSVHDYTNRGKSQSTALAKSSATVNVYKGSALVATYHMPTNVTGTIWTVFELSGDEIKPINKIGNGIETDVSKF